MDLGQHGPNRTCGPFFSFSILYYFEGLINTRRLGAAFGGVLQTERSVTRPHPVKCITHLPGMPSEEGKDVVSGEDFSVVAKCLIAKHAPIEGTSNHPPTPSPYSPTVLIPFLSCVPSLLAPMEQAVCPPPPLFPPLTTLY